MAVFIVPPLYRPAAGHPGASRAPEWTPAPGLVVALGRLVDAVAGVDLGERRGAREADDVDDEHRALLAGTEAVDLGRRTADAHAERPGRRAAGVAHGERVDRKARAGVEDA